MHKYGEKKTTQIILATLRDVSSSSGIRKFQVDGFFFNWVYNKSWWVRLLPWSHEPFFMGLDSEHLVPVTNMQQRHLKPSMTEGST